jgi:hypothetical protein
MTRRVQLERFKVKRFKDVRWSGTAAKMFHSLSGENREVWKMPMRPMMPLSLSKAEL